MATQDQASDPQISSPDVDSLTAALSPLRDAGSGRSLLELGWIRRLRRQDSRALFELALPGFAASQRDRIASEARQALLTVAGIEDIQIELAQPEGAPAGAAPSSAPIGGAGHGPGSHGHPPSARACRGCAR